MSTYIDLLCNSLIEALDDDLRSYPQAAEVEEISYQDTGAAIVPDVPTPGNVDALLSEFPGRYVHVPSSTVSKTWKRELNAISEYELSFNRTPAGVTRIARK